MDKQNNKKQAINTSLAFLPISAVASALGVHQRTLRIYEKEEILIPKRTAKNRRCYSLDDLELAKFIHFLTRNLAVNLSGVKIILEILKQNKIKLSDYTKYIEKIAHDAGFDTKAQEENIEKTSKKGRKANASK